MTTETVRDRFGEPLKRVELGSGEFSWYYLNRETDYIVVAMAWWVTPVMAPFFLANGEKWNLFFMKDSDAILHFEEDVLARWLVIPHPIPEWGEYEPIPGGPVEQMRERAGGC